MNYGMFGVSAPLRGSNYIGVRQVALQTIVPSFNNAVWAIRMRWGYYIKITGMWVSYINFFSFSDFSPILRTCEVSDQYYNKINEMNVVYHHRVLWSKPCTLADHA
jgi:hypothetical protein